MDRLADALGQHGTAVAVARACPAIDTGPPYLVRWLEEVADNSPRGDAPWVVVGFSAAGSRLTALQKRLRRTGREADALVYLDARLPSDGVPADAEPRFGALLDALDDGGVLAPWVRWWGDDVLADLLPDAAIRQDLISECPSMPRAFFAEPIPDPSDSTPSAYVALGDGYADQRSIAQSRGWPVVTVEDANHLWVLSRPDEVALAVLHAIEML